VEVYLSISKILGDDEQIYDLFLASINYLGIKKGLFSATDLLGLMDNNLNEHKITNMLYALEAEGVVMESPLQMGRYSLVDGKQLENIVRRAFFYGQIDSSFRAQLSMDTPILLATVPQHLSQNMDGENQFEDLFSTIHKLITDSRQEIILASPFFEEEGVNMLATTLQYAIRRGVKVKIITRRTSENTTIIKKLISSIDGSSRENLFIYEYKEKLDGESFTFHAKVLVADRSKAYLGSANFTQYGFERNIELGVLLKGKQVKPLYSLLNVMLSSRGCTPFFS
jgi:HKD family nuclease